MAEVLNVMRSLQGLSRDVVVRPPTLPTESVAVNKSLVAVLAALGSGLLLDAVDLHAPSLEECGAGSRSG